MTVPLDRALEAVDFITGRGSYTTYLALLFDSYAVLPENSAAFTMGNIGGAELSAAGYARQTIAWSAPALVDGAAESSNTGVITFGPFTDPIGSGAQGIQGLAVVTDASGVGGTARYGTAIDPELLDAVQNDTLTLGIGVLKVRSI
jgi:hypothetical protein